MKKIKLLYGLKIVGVSFVTLRISYGVWYSFSVFLVAILNEFTWNRASTAGGFSLFTLVHSFAGFIVGSVLERFGTRRLIPLGSFFIILGLLASAPTHPHTSSRRSRRSTTGRL